MKRSVTVFGAAAALLLVGALQAQDFTLGWSNCPEEVVGPGNSTQTLETFVTLTTANNPGTDGAQGWSLSIEVVNADVTTVTLKGVTVDTYYCEDDDGDPGTPCIEHPSFIQDLGDPTVFTKIANKATYKDDPTRKGAISAVVLRGQEKMVLQPTGTQTILKLVISATIPEELPDVQNCKDVILKFENDFKSSVSQPVKNVITFGGASITPVTTECVVKFCTPKPVGKEFNLAIVPLGGTPAADGDTTIEQEVDPGDVLFSVNVLLSTANLPAGDGPQGWSLSIANEACMTVNAVTLKGVTVNTNYCQDDDGDPGTPCIDQQNFVQDLGAPEVFTKIANKATGEAPSPINDPNQKGVISAVVLRGQEKMVLYPNATDTILKIEYKLTVAEGETVTCKAFILDGLKSSVSQPVNNVITYQGGSQAPNKKQGLILKLTGKVKPADVPFRHGDPNNDGKINIADAVRIVMAVVPEIGPPITCPVTGDVDDNGRLEIVDAVYLLDYEFRHGPAIVDPVLCTLIIGKGITPDTCPSWKEYCP